jgi:hypothetical protein
MIGLDRVIPSEIILLMAQGKTTASASLFFVAISREQMRFLINSLRGHDDSPHQHQL